MVNLAYVANEPTPYRLHLLGRMADELADVRLHSIFTHTVDMPTMPWAERPSEKINPVHFGDASLGAGGGRSPKRARRLSPRRSLTARPSRPADRARCPWTCRARSCRTPHCRR